MEFDRLRSNIKEEILFLKTYSKHDHILGDYLESLNLYDEILKTGSNDDIMLALPHMKREIDKARPVLEKFFEEHCRLFHIHSSCGKEIKSIHKGLTDTLTRLMHKSGGKRTHKNNKKSGRRRHSRRARSKRRR
jgi:hypothetical protein